MLTDARGLPVLTWPALDHPGLTAVVTTRAGGVSTGPYARLNLSLAVGDDPELVVENRRRAAGALGLTADDLVFCQQVHGDKVAPVGAADRGRGARSHDDAIPGADALVTAERGVGLAIMVADCVPMVLHEPEAHVLACVHAGWRGTVARIAAAAVAEMAGLGADPARIVAGIGPAIPPDRYEVGDEVVAAARATFGDRAEALLPPGDAGRRHFDLWAANRLVLTDAGVPTEQIHVAAVPTGAPDGRFFSHRAANPCGRFAALACLRDRRD